MHQQDIYQHHQNRLKAYHPNSKIHQSYPLVFLTYCTLYTVQTEVSHCLLFEVKNMI